MKISKKNIYLLLLLFFSAFVFGQNAKGLKVIFAEKTPWVGGVSGVTGTNYLIKIKKCSKTSYNFKNLYAEGETIPVTVKLENGIYVVRANYSKTVLPTLELPPTDSVEKQPQKDTNQFWLEYTTGTSKTIQKLKVSTFTTSKNPTLYE